ncbi:hypothetical protein BDV24DRAFT_136110 [Aspergillus arachidicola]|uniref:Uncharacterized protein n=1 Tax=Aspergillus arachidicola TaxID=656916 RepID=A0A5N6Y1G2_9EURO|nr:hypothetical protein BDV24DRAFT_136110 [Aspergillus arachidicola]
MRFSRAPIPVPNSREKSVDHCWIFFVVITVVIQQLHNGLSDSVRGVDIPSRGSSNVFWCHEYALCKQVIRSNYVLYCISSYV